jgi:hypothetical protein
VVTGGTAIDINFGTPVALTASTPTVPSIYWYCFQNSDNTVKLASMVYNSNTGYNSLVGARTPATSFSGSGTGTGTILLRTDTAGTHGVAPTSATTPANSSALRWTEQGGSTFGNYMAKASAVISSIP